MILYPLTNTMSVPFELVFEPLLAKTLNREFICLSGVYKMLHVKKVSLERDDFHVEAE